MESEATFSTVKPDESVLALSMDGEENIKKDAKNKAAVPLEKRPISQHKKDKCAVKGMALLLQQMRSQAAADLSAKKPLAQKAGENCRPDEPLATVSSNAEKSDRADELDPIPVLEIEKLTEPILFELLDKDVPDNHILAEPKMPAGADESDRLLKETAVASHPTSNEPAVNLSQTLDDKCISLDVQPLTVLRDIFETAMVPNYRFSSVIKANNYVRSCKWRPDGRALVTESQDYNVRVLRFDDNDTFSLLSTSNLGGLVYDIQWHPHVDLLAVTSREAPIHLLDSAGRRRLSFRGINQLDELAYAYSMAFSLDGWTLYAGYYKMLRIFDLGRPGRHINEIQTFVKDGVSSGQKALLSTIAACPTMHGVYAVGCYGGSVGLYSDHTGVCDALFPTAGMGVTHLQYATGGNQLYVGYRKSNLLECYDLRFPIKVLSSFHRPALTNQRFYFQLDGGFDRYLFSASSTGSVLIYDLKNKNINNQCIANGQPIQPRWQLPVSRATVTGLSVHPTRPLLAASSGQRVFPRPTLRERSSSSSSSDEGDRELRTPYAKCRSENELDNALKIFKI